MNGNEEIRSHFGWIDFAEDDRQKMLEVVRLFQEQDTRDELGIGVIRDAFSDYFFPGTSTIQTRARYMLFIPWIYLELENKKIGYPEVIERARRNETKLIYALLRSKDHNGVIGKDVKEKLQRLPSSIYWSGLEAWGIRLFKGSQEQYHRYINRFERRLKDSFSDGDEDNGDAHKYEVIESWHNGIPSAPEDFLEHSDLSLKLHEAEYLKGRIYTRHPDSLLAILIGQEVFVDTDFIWTHPIIKDLEAELIEEIKHAQNFSEVIYGAALLYNLMLSQKSQAQKAKEWQAFYLREMNNWSQIIMKRWDELAVWFSDGGFWRSKSFNTIPASSNSQSFERTKVFVNNWFSLVFKGQNLLSVKKDEDAINLIYEREVYLKRSRARLENQRALDLWNGAAGAFQLDYRYRVAKQLMSDIISGVKNR